MTVNFFMAKISDLKKLRQMFAIETVIIKYFHQMHTLHNAEKISTFLLESV